MVFSRKFCLLTLMLILTGSLPVVSLTAQKKSQKSVLFCLERYEDGKTAMEPIVILSSGKFLAPPTGIESTEDLADQDVESVKFLKNYYRKGQSYRVVFGTAEDGTVTVMKPQESGCVSLSAQVSVASSVKLGGRVYALATDHPTLGVGKKRSRRAPTPEERSAAIAIAKDFLRGKKVPAALMKLMQVGNLTAVDLNGDGKDELVGNFEIDQSDTVLEARSLFFILSPVGVEFKIAFSEYYQGSEEQYRRSIFIDHLDLDGDDISEVIVRTTYYESFSYSIIKNKGGKWVNVYTGGESGC